MFYNGHSINGLAALLRPCAERLVFLLDSFTLFVGNALIHLALALALWIISRLAPDILAVRLWTRAHGLMALALALMAWMSQAQPGLQAPLKLLIGAAVMSGLVLVLAGLRHFFGLRPLPPGLKAAYLAAIGMLPVWMWLSSPTLPAAVAWMACVVTLLLLASARMLWRQRRQLRPLIFWPCLGSLVSVLCGMCLRLFLLALSVALPEQRTDLQQASNQVGLLVAMLGGIGLAMSFWLLITDRMVFALQRIAEIDPLTNVLNRRGFQRAADALLARRPNNVVVMMLDVDHFKRFNDQFGHPAGDQVLRCMGEALRDVLRASDVFARLGGEEFCVVLHDQPASRAQDVGEQIRQHFRDKTQQLDTRSACTLSVGLTVGDPRLCSLAELMAQADLALYCSKAQGRDQLRCYDDAPLVGEALG